MVDYACTQKKKDVPKVLAQVSLQTDDGRKMKDLDTHTQMGGACFIGPVRPPRPAWD